ncbi:hypothetical protein KR067_003887, partial [Drosophila pandora]
ICERECVQRIVSKLNTGSHPDDNESPGDLFLKVYRKLLAVKIDSNLRHSLMCFLLTLADKSMELKSINGTGAGGDNLKHTLGIRNPSSSTHSINGSTSSHSSRQNGSVGIYSYDATQSSVGFGRQPLPDYMTNMKAQKNLEATQDIVMNAIYSFTGVQGKYLKKDVVSGRFKLDPVNAKTLSPVQAGMLLRLSELGYYHDRVAKFADVTTGFNAMGCMGQAFISKLKEELMEFHGQVAVLHDELTKFRDNQLRQHIEKDRSWMEKTEPGALGEVTLLKLLAWYVTPLHRMQWLTKIADTCQLRKGGELASAVFNYLDNGNSMVNELASSLLTAICGPLVRMISKWMLEGGICDSYGEFFVESLNEVGADRLWHDKFRLRVNMMPKFITLELADKILKTGKSINFLREICEMTELVRGREELKELMNNNVSHIFSYVQDTNWHAAVETCYQQTSKHVLDIMVGPHKLLDHLHGMRRYLLLGQGDFVSILIENMKDELERKGTDIYAHDLSAMLDAALRCTNAQYDDPEILNHLDVVVQTPFPGDCGWDIISLQYIVQGPLATMLEPTMPTYKALFKPLWRMKHMEFVLSMKIWKEQMGNSKILRMMNPEIGKASYRLHLFTSEIMHFIHQMQYYVLFEVIECNWVELQKKMVQATALDDILEAHEKFLKTITVGCFVNTMTDMERHLETVYENIIGLENWQSAFYKECFKELDARKALAKKVMESEASGQFGLTADEIFERDHERKQFDERVSIACRGLDDIAIAYEKAVSGFLLALNSNNDPNLQLFGTRLDFNEYYKKRDTNLSKPLTFEHMRMSSVFSTSNKLSHSSRFVIHPQASKE